MALKGISTGKKDRPALVLIFGGDGLGKSTFASEAPSPVFLGPEEGTANLDVARFDNIKTFSDIMLKIDELINEDHSFKTLAIDSLDHIEPLLWKEICKEGGNVDVIEDAFGGFGRGFTRANQKWVEMQHKLSQLREKKGMNIIIIGHSQIKPFNDPKQPAPYDRHILKLNEKASALWREFVDCVLFVDNDTVVRKEKGQQKAKAYGENKRILYTERRPAFDAKNRYGLPAEMPFELGESWAVFFTAMKAGQPDSLDKVMLEINDLMGRADAETKLKMQTAVANADNDVNKLVKIRNHARVLVGEE